jgi:DNA recombination protein RmuC
MLITILLCVIALGVGWAAGSARSRERIAHAGQALAVAEARVADLQRMENAFAATAQRVFTDLGTTIVQQNRVQVGGSLETTKAEIATLLEPLNLMLDQYQGQLQKSERIRNEVYGGLQEQIKTLLATQQSAQREAARLANALQSPTVRGSWGENALKRCLELAGMSEFCDFETQETFLNDEGRRLRPDVVVHLPNHRVIAIDAKVPLTEYSAAANETDENRRREFLGQHVKTLRRHIDSLSRREYQTSIGDTLDFTVMFLPGEHFLSAGLITDPTLFEYAAEKKVVLASPTVLLPLLRAVAIGWKAERTEENAKKMHETGVELFKRFKKVMDLVAELGGQLGKTVEKYNETIRSIDTRLWPKGEELQRMAESGNKMEPIDEIDAVPHESSKLRLTMQQSEPGDVVKITG